MKLVRVVRTAPMQVAYPIGRRGETQVLHPIGFQGSSADIYNNFVTHGEFFLCPENEVDQMVEFLATTNPGRDVEVYTLESAATCPAAPIVKKKVTPDGILPL